MHDVTHTRASKYMRVHNTYFRCAPQECRFATINRHTTVITDDISEPPPPLHATVRTLRTRAWDAFHEPLPNFHITNFTVGSLRRTRWLEFPSVIFSLTMIQSISARKAFQTLAIILAAYFRTLVILCWASILTVDEHFVQYLQNQSYTVGIQEMLIADCPAARSTYTVRAFACTHKYYTYEQADTGVCRRMSETKTRR